jgi:hypothetical protein
MTVDIGIPSVSAMFRQLFPCFRSLMAISRRKTRLGRPRAVPRAFAARTPAQTRSRIIPRSISANAGNRCMRNLDMGLSAPVSIDSVGLRKRMPSETSSWMDRTQCATLRPQRSSFQTSTPSNFWSRASRRSWSSRRPAGDGAAESRIHIFLKDLPALAGDVFSERVELHIATLVRRTDSSVNGDDHGF